MRQQSSSQKRLLYGTTGSTYELGRSLGNGGMGSVYLAQQRDGSQRGGQLVAIKLLRPDAHEQARCLFYHEGTLLPRLRHQSIVRFVENGRGAQLGTEPLDYLALGFVAGSTVEELVRKQERPLAPQVVLGIVAQVAQALVY